MRQIAANIWKYYLFAGLNGVFFMLPIIVLFWQENGLNLTEIMILQAIFAIMIVVLEVPTGYFADRFGRKTSLLLSASCLLVGILIYSLGTGFSIFLVGELLMALSVSLASGANSAFLYDTLKDLGRVDEYKKVFGTSILIGLGVLALSNIAGGFIGAYDYRWTFYVMFPFIFGSIIVASTFFEPKIHKPVIKKHYVTELKEIFVHVITQKRLLWFMIFSGFAFAFTQLALWMYQPYFVLSGLDVMYYGIVFASFHIVAGFASKFSHVIEQKIGLKPSLMLLVIAAVAGHLLMSQFIFLFSFVFAYLHQFSRGLYQPIITDYINKLTRSEIRATVLSIQSMIKNVVYALLLPLFGYAADLYSITQALSILGITSLVICGLLFVVLQRNGVFSASHDNV